MYRSIIFLLITLLAVSGCRSKKIIAAKSKLDIRSITNIGLRDDIDDSDAIQEAVDYCFYNKIDTLFFPSGKYTVNSVGINPGLVFIGESGTVMKKIPYAGKWSRMFTTQDKHYNGNEDSELIVFKNIKFDGNKSNQGNYKNYELQQQHIIFFDASTTNQGRVKGLIENCTFENSVADGVSLWCNADVKVLNCKAYNVFRGGVVATGGNSKLWIENFEAGGSEDITGIDVEVDGAGYNNRMDIEVTLLNLKLAGDFDIGMPDNGSLLADNVRVSGPGFFLHAQNSRAVVIKNSEFVINTIDNSNIYFPGNVTFSNCNFLVQKSDSNIVGLNIFMETSYRREGNQKLEFDNCNFQLEGSGTKSSHALFNQENFTHLNSNQLVVKNTVFSGAFDSAILFDKGGNAVLDNIYIKDGNAISMNSIAGRTPMDLKIEKIRIHENVGTIFRHYNPASSDKISVKYLILNQLLRNDLIINSKISISNLIDLSNRNERNSNILFDGRGLVKSGL